MATKKAVHIESIRDLANTADDRRGQIAVASDAEADRWSAQKAFEETGDEGVLPQIMVNGQMKKVSKRDSNKWNDKGTGAMDDATFAKHDEEMFSDNFWKKEWLLVTVGVLVLLLDIFACWSIYSAVEDNNRANGWGPKTGETGLIF